jgi:TetR/AcrR family transcriptional repressor of nem operon
VPQQPAPQPPRRLTARGIATRARIVSAADELIRVRGVNGTTLDEVAVASGSSKSQLYHHFADKESLVHAVIASRAVTLLEREEQYLRRTDSLQGLERWRRAVLQRVTLRNGAFGCTLGSLSNELADQDEIARVALAQHFGSWEGIISSAFERIKNNGELKAAADPTALATALMAALQGGYLLAQTAHDPAPMRLALDMAFAHIRSYAT